jgi:tRNA (guanine37-N1)-methyltransferase
MKIQIISLFPEIISPALNSSMMYKAQKLGAAQFELINLRDYGLGPRKTVDDTPYGGGDGMLLMVEPLVSAIEAAKQSCPDSLVILPTPAGKEYIQSEAKELALINKDLILVCPRYEGYDQRVTSWVDRQYKIGNYVLTGGELPALIIVDSVVRLLPNVLGGETSAEFESFQEDDRTVEYPQYTRPEIYRGLKVPDVLLSGNHQNIAKWRKENSRL